MEAGNGAASLSEDAFLQKYGREPDGVWTAPGRMNLLGEHTDYNNGFVLPFALSQNTFAAASARPDRILKVFSLQGGNDVVELNLDRLEPGAVSGWVSYVAGTVWAMEYAGYPVPGLELGITTEVPVGAGLSSSAALECAVALAVATLADVEVEPMMLARIAQRAENDFVGMPCGIMDQVASLLGREGHAVLLDAQHLEVEYVPFSLEAYGMRLLVIDSQAEHQLVDGEYAARREQCEAGAEQWGVGSLRELTDLGVEAEDLAAKIDDPIVLRRVRHVITENQRVFAMRDDLQAGRYESIGHHLTASHVSQRNDFEITVPETDLIVETLLSGGASGARQVGGGFGGCVVGVVPEAKAEQVLEKVTSASVRAGFPQPKAIPARPSQGARRII